MVSPGDDETLSVLVRNSLIWAEKARLKSLYVLNYKANGLSMTFDLLLGSNNDVGSFCLIMVRD